jgi:hypothetical protein
MVIKIFSSVVILSLLQNETHYLAVHYSHGNAYLHSGLGSNTYSLVGDYQHFGMPFCSHLQVRTHFYTEDADSKFLHTPTRLYGVINQKTAIKMFI